MQQPVELVLPGIVRRVRLAELLPGQDISTFTENALEKVVRYATSLAHRTSSAAMIAFGIASTAELALGGVVQKSIDALYYHHEGEFRAAMTSPMCCGVFVLVEKRGLLELDGMSIRDGRGIASPQP